MRLIDADALLRDIERYHVSDGKFQHWVEAQPTIEPERKKGRWVKAVGTSGIRRSRCSECGKYYPHDTEFPFNVPSGYNYCPNCGAYMGDKE